MTSLLNSAVSFLGQHLKPTILEIGGSPDVKREYRHMAQTRVVPREWLIRLVGSLDDPLMQDGEGCLGLNNNPLNMVNTENISYE